MDSKEPGKGILDKIQSWWLDFRHGYLNEEKLGWLLDISDALTWKRWLIVAGVVFVISLGGCYAMLGSSGHHAHLDKSQKIYFTVREGMNASDIADALLERGVIDSKFAFWWKVKTGGYQDQFKIGTYALHPQMAEEEVLALLISGETARIKFTIPEGFKVEEIARRLADEGIADRKRFLRIARDFAPYSYMKKHENVDYAAEGFLFPDTYEVEPDMDEKAIMQMMFNDFDNRLNDELRERAREMDLSIYDLITLASLVEKEARYDEDRPIIAQVFFKRLKEDMPLQTDASLQYLMDAPKEDVSIADTKIDSPYNTYQNRGLPPGPIANPGMEAIEAVLYPADTEYLYFVADRDGHNHYSMTYDEHLVLVDRYR